MARHYYSNEEHKSFQEALFLLGYGEEQTEEELKKRYRLLMQEHHPDKIGDKSESIKGLISCLGEAYEDMKSDNVDIRFIKKKLKDKKESQENEYKGLTLEELKNKILQEQKEINDLQRENKTIFNKIEEIIEKVNHIDKELEIAKFQCFKSANTYEILQKSYLKRIIEMISLKETLKSNPKTIKEYKSKFSDVKFKTLLKAVPIVILAGGLVVALSSISPIIFPVLIVGIACKYILDEKPNSKYKVECKRQRKTENESQTTIIELEDEKASAKEDVLQLRNKKIYNNSMINYHEGNLIILKGEFDETISREIQKKEGKDNTSQTEPKTNSYR